MQKTALITFGIVFSFLSISYAIRWLSPVKIIVDGNVLPFITSLSSCIILALLSIWIYIAAKKIKSTSIKNKDGA
ncbi:MAG TPA: hypothetical protein EYQ84_05215 [Nitrospinaceae bacterium]|jgi:hypothetical protein|nr:hypothetical protein [Nitrospinaceae bacterium]